MAGIANKMKIIDSFLFSEVFEKELLLIKFILEDGYINEWIILENAYSFQGEYKGLHVENLLDSDERFAPYKSRITIIAKEMKSALLNKEQVLDEKAFEVEFWQRDLAYDYFITNYSDEDWIIISDVDEALDFTDDVRRDELLSKMMNNTQGLLHVSTRRYWFDFDNEYKPLYGIPMCTRKHLLQTGKKLHDVRVEYHADLKMEWKNIIGFEYSSCFNADNIFRKLETGSHMGYTKADLQQALYCNHRITSKGGRELKATDRFFFNTIELNRSNSPQYVRDNLSVLKTGNIHPNYKENRREMYPHLFSPLHVAAEFFNASFQIINKKIRLLLRRLKLEKAIYG